eukprot:7215323-Alexandrium_andersonii.AAC.1
MVLVGRGATAPAVGEIAVKAELPCGGRSDGEYASRSVLVLTLRVGESMMAMGVGAPAVPLPVNGLRAGHRVPGQPRAGG